jgi:hypothetical protein
VTNPSHDCPGAGHPGHCAHPSHKPVIGIRLANAVFNAIDALGSAVLHHTSRGQNQTPACQTSAEDCQNPTMIRHHPVGVVRAHHQGRLIAALRFDLTAGVATVGVTGMPDLRPKLATEIARVLEAFAAAGHAIEEACIEDTAAQERQS